MRLVFAYLIGINALGLVVAVSYVVGSLLRIAPLVALIGLVAGLGLGVLAGWRTDKALERLFQ
jgi:predicted membrane protein